MADQTGGVGGGTGKEVGTGGVGMQPLRPPLAAPAPIATTSATVATSDTQPAMRKKKHAPVSVRFSVTEQAQLRTTAKDRGMSVSQYLRHLAGYPPAVMGRPKRR